LGRRNIPMGQVHSELPDDSRLPSKTVALDLYSPAPAMRTLSTGSTAQPCIDAWDTPADTTWDSPAAMAPLTAKPSLIYSDKENVLPIPSHAAQKATVVFLDARPRNAASSQAALNMAARSDSRPAALEAAASAAEMASVARQRIAEIGNFLEEQRSAAEAARARAAEAREGSERAREQLTERVALATRSLSRSGGYPAARSLDQPVFVEQCHWSENLEGEPSSPQHRSPSRPHSATAASGDEGSTPGLQTPTPLNLRARMPSPDSASTCSTEEPRHLGETPADAEAQTRVQPQPRNLNMEWEPHADLVSSEWCAVPEEWQSNLAQELPKVPCEREPNLDFSDRDEFLEAQEDAPRSSMRREKNLRVPLFVDLDGDLPEVVLLLSKLQKRSL